MTSHADMAMGWVLDAASSQEARSHVPDADHRAAFHRLVREHLEMLHGLARRLGPAPEEAEDLVQETLLRAWSSRRRFRREADLRTWLYRILVNASRDRWRRRVRRRPRLEHAAGPVDPAQRLVRCDAVTRVIAAVGELPPRQRECLLLRVRANLSHQEIAELLRIRPGVVKLHLVHARKALHRRFGEEVREWGIATR